MLRYKLIKFINGLEEELEVILNTLLDEGWHLHGGPFYGNGYIYQAVIRQENNG